MSIEIQKMNFKSLDRAYDVLISAIKYDEIVIKALGNNHSNKELLKFLVDNIRNRGVDYHSTYEAYHEAQVERHNSDNISLGDSIRLTSLLNLAMRCLYQVINDRYEIVYGKEYLNTFMKTLNLKQRDFLFETRRLSSDTYEILTHKKIMKKLSGSEDKELTEALYNNYEAVRFFYSEDVRVERLVIPESKHREVA